MNQQRKILAFKKALGLHKQKFVPKQYITSGGTKYYARCYKTHKFINIDKETYSLMVNMKYENSSSKRSNTTT